MQELHRRLAKATVHLHREGYEAVAMRLHSCIRTPLLLVPMGCRRSSRGSRLGEGIHGEGVDDRNVGDGDALWQGHEDVAPSLGANGRDVGGGASAGSEDWESAEGWLKDGCDARPVHSTAQNPFQDVIAQHELCGKGGASHGVVGVRAVEGGSAATLHGGGIEGQDGEAETVWEGSQELPALKFKGC
jgi:hypothetical protein